jgi:hypothetical protein
LAGAVALVSAFTRTRNDTWGFVLSYVVPFLWGTAYLISWYPLREINAGTAMRAGILYWGYSALVVIISGWPEVASEKETPLNEHALRHPE